MKNKNQLMVISAMVGIVLALAAGSPTSADIQNTYLSEQSIKTSANQPETTSDVLPVELEVETISVEYVEPIEVSTVFVGDASISQEEIDGLIFMREEEKLARDVYLYLYHIWGAQVFNNIASSEEAHMEAVLTLIERYGLDDPASGMAQGEFNNPDLQALYDQLIQQGSVSLLDAFKVGAAIEEIDILDLQVQLEHTQKQDLIAVYQNLLAGSANHLAAFSRNITNQIGETYQPQYLTEEAYEEILAGSPGNGTGGRWGNRGN